MAELCHFSQWGTCPHTAPDHAPGLRHARRCTVKNWRYLLSKLIPVPMRSSYKAVPADGDPFPEKATWVQWRGRTFAVRRHPNPASCPPFAHTH